jgi:hypothetical protein
MNPQKPRYPNKNQYLLEMNPNETRDPNENQVPQAGIAARIARIARGAKDRVVLMN